jgi:hypothetical protein
VKYADKKRNCAQAPRAFALDCEELKRNLVALGEPGRRFSDIKISITGKIETIQVFFGCLRILDTENHFYPRLLLVRL